MMKIWDVVQKSPEWLALRREYPLTASEALAIKVGGAGLKTIVFEKMSELYSSGEAEQFSSKNTDRGNDSEPTARALYELETGVTVKEVGFITDDEISAVGGASPDGLVGEDGLWEGKAFGDSKHFRMIIDGLEIESQYMAQMQMQMLFTGRKWCDFSAYCPNHKPSLLTTRVYADEEMQKAIIEGLKKGETLIAEIKNKLK